MLTMTRLPIFIKARLEKSVLQPTPLKTCVDNFEAKSQKLRPKA